MPLGSSIAGVPESLDPGGPAADDIATLWWVMLTLGAVVFALVIILLVAPMRRRRRQGREPSDDHGDVPATMANRWIVGLGVVMPAVLLVAVLAMSVSTMRTVSRAAPDDSVVIEVTAYQYWWSAHYPADDVTVANEIHIPAGEPVELRLISDDVIHSFWVPELQGKLDMLPDGPNTLALEADEPGEYLGACAEFCGLQHANMGFLVIAQPRAEFAAWLEAQRQPAAEPVTEAAQRGRALFVDEGCGACHAVAGAVGAAEVTDDGPDLTHIASRRTLAADTVVNTPQDMARWLRDPDEIKEGTTMPAPDLTEDEIEDLVAYLEGLQ